MKKTSIPTIIVLAVLFIIHKFALDGQLYVKYVGLDILMHILGGLGLALGINLVLKLIFPTYETTFWSLIGLTFLGGFFWEVFETINDIAGDKFGTYAYYFDSIKDLVNDTLGAIIAAWFLKK